MKSYKILRSQGDDAEWNMLILREYFMGKNLRTQKWTER